MAGYTAVRFGVVKVAPKFNRPVTPDPHFQTVSRNELSVNLSREGEVRRG